MKRANFLVLSVALVVILISGCSITQQRHREARLMPEPVALKIVAKHTSVIWAQNPSAMAALANHPLCDDQTAYPMPYNTMRLAWDFTGVQVWGGYDVGFWCGTNNSILFNVTEPQEQDDLIDALTSLGAQTKVN